MKKLLLFALCLCFATANFCSAKNKTVKAGNLPSTVQQFVKENFSKAKIVTVTQESDDLDYNLVLSDGTKLEFGKDNQWSEICNKKGQIPVKLIPQGVSSYVKTHFAHRAVVCIERSSKGYDVALNNHKHFQLDLNFKPTKFKDAD